MPSFSKLAVLAAFATSPSEAEEKLIFSDDFNTLNMTTWQHEITAGGGGNWEFEYYTNNRTNSFVKEGVLHLQPTLTSDRLGEDGVRTGSLELWGSTPADLCTGNQFYGCMRQGNGNTIVNPIQSARLRSVNSFAFKYGRVQISAKMPQGDWLWPAIWMLPKDNAYGGWPASGEIDILESYGNQNCDGGNNSMFGSTLHFGPGYPYNAWEKAHKMYTHTESLANAFHTYELEWTKDHIKTFIDGNVVLDLDMSKEDMFTYGDFPKELYNPWQYETDKNAPFNQEYYLIFNVAVGGVQGYFEEGKCGKPWSNMGDNASFDFYQAKGAWWNTWNYPDTNDAAMKIDWVKVWSIDEEGNQKLEEESKGKTDFLQ